MTIEEIKTLIKDHVKYLDWRFVVTTEGDNHFVHINADGVDSDTGKPCNWNSRKWRLSLHMVPTEIVSTCFMATRSAVEHEMRENFRYKGKSIFGPHIDIETLVEMSDQVDVR